MPQLSPTHSELRPSKSMGLRVHSHREILATIFFWAPATVKPEPSSLRYEVTGLPPSGGPQRGLMSFRRRAIRKPRTPRSAAATTAAWNPATTPAAAAEAGPAEGGSNAPATVRSIASPTGNPTREDVLTTPEARPSSPGCVPATAAMLIAGKPMLAPSAQTSRPGISTSALPLGDIGKRRRVPKDTNALERRSVRFAPNLLTRREAPHPPTTKKMSAGGRVCKPE